MNEKLNRKQRITFFFINLISFASIFLVLGLIVFQLLKTSIYQSTDEDLKRLAENDSFIAHQLSKEELFSSDNQRMDTQTLPEKLKIDIPPPNNFQQQVILWSKDGVILNATELGSRFYDFQGLKLKTDNLNKVVDVTVKDSNSRTLQFRSITLPIEADKEVAYIQLLVNSDPIQGTVEQFKRILIICMVIFSILSIGLSYFISKFSMKRIIISWKKQQEFVENASHELRTPLTIIQAKLEKLFTHPSHTILEESETIALSLDEVRRLSQLTNDLLLLARSDSNALTLEKEEIPVTAFLENILIPYQELTTAEQKEFVIDLGQEQVVSFDKQKIHQLLVILLDNALKYTVQGEKITVLSFIKNNEWIIKIIDNGIGISDEKKKLVFERFYRGEESRNRKSGGYGIGLSIAKWIVNEHQGEISLTDTYPKGTTVTLRFPVK